MMALETMAAWTRTVLIATNARSFSGTTSIGTDEQHTIEQQKATGTDGQLAQKLAQTHDLPFRSVSQRVGWGDGSDDAKSSSGKDVGVTWQRMDRKSKVRPAGFEPRPCGLEVAEAIGRVLREKAR
jgi:hypothetical protein